MRVGQARRDLSQGEGGNYIAGRRGAEWNVLEILLNLDNKGKVMNKGDCHEGAQPRKEGKGRVQRSPL